MLQRASIKPESHVASPLLLELAGSRVQHGTPFFEFGRDLAERCGSKHESPLKFFIGMMLVTNIYEIRVFGELIPVFLMAFLLIIIKVTRADA